MVSRYRFSSIVVVGSILAMMLGLVATASAHPEGPAHHSPMPPDATEVMRAFAADQQPAATGVPLSTTACPEGGGFAGPYPCDNVDLLSYLPLSEIGGTRSNSAANDVWGWTDSNGKEYAIIGRVFGTSFVDISDPANPVYLGELPTHGSFGSSWRDIKVYADHAFIVSEALNHGMQVFDLTRLRNRTGPPVTFTETAHYNKVASAHNIAINEATGYAYIVGASGKNSCSGGLHMVDITAPTGPTFAGCFDADGYTHDAQCVIYSGPDAAYRGREICLNSNEDTITIVDVTNKSNPLQVARVGYDGSGYTHQGWLTEDQVHFLLDDELDEQNFGHKTLTRVWDVSDLDNPTHIKTSDFLSTATAIDHNQYVKGGHSYQANYRAGLRVLKISDSVTLDEVGYFDIYPEDDLAEFNGAWSNYPYFASGNVIVSGIEQGLFVLRPTNVDGGGGGATASITITEPPDDATVRGQVTLAATTNGDIDEVTFSVGEAVISTDSDATDGWSATWDSTTVTDGSYGLTAVGSVTGGGTVEDTITVAVDNVADSVHVGDLDGSSTPGRGGRWNATVTITVHDQSHAPVDGVSVEGSWSTGGTPGCVTDAGTCSVTLTGINKNTSDVTYTVGNVTKAGYTYDQGANHDPDTDSQGTTINISRP